MKKNFLNTILVFLLFCVIPGNAEETMSVTKLRVYAASSLKEVLEECAQIYGQRVGEKIEFNFAASSLLARQIEAGAECDLYISADKDWMDYLEQKGFVSKKFERDWISNSIVLISPVSLQISGNSLKEKMGMNQEKIIMGDPDHVPAGKYSKAALSELGLWESIKFRVIPAESTRSALKGVETGSAERGVVFMTDAIHSSRVKILEEIPYSGKIIYPIGIIGDALKVQGFFDFLFSKDVLSIIVKHGFISLTGEKA